MRQQNRLNALGYPRHRANRLFAVASFILVMLPTTVRTATAEEPEAGLVGKWSFDEQKGRLATDSSGRANHAIVADGLLVKGVTGLGLQFDGRSTAANCPHLPSLTFREALSIEAWFRLNQQPESGFPTIVRRDNCFALRFSSGRLGFLLWLDGQLVSLGSKKTDWETERWYHVAAVYDGSEMRLLIDGQEDGSSPHAASGTIDQTQTHLGIGSCGSAYLFTGVIDEVCVYDRARAGAEVRASYEKGRVNLLAQKDVDVQPGRIGATWVEFRKPKRDIQAVKEGFLWIDAEDFGNYGGWWLDTQFVHLMGSAYLIAAGVGTPVEDATVEVEIPRAGTYRLWVRAKNWQKEHSPGRFAVRVGDMLSDSDFGIADTEDWHWQSGGDFELPPGCTRIALHDLTGYYGRCDALLLTSDLDYAPPDAVAAIVRERSRLTGLSPDPKLVGDFDVIVVGAGAAGSCAALTSARMGAKTALIQNRPVLGGNASIELGVPISGASCCHRNARESGIIEEVGRIKARYGYPKMSEPFRVAAEQEPNLSMYMNQHVVNVGMENDHTIRAVKAVDTLTGEITVYRAKAFLDCTGDGWIGYYAKAEYRLGREARSEFNESLAPESPDQITMSGCLMGRRALSYRAEHMGEPAPYVPPAWAAKLPPASRFGRRPRGFAGGEWWLEHPGTIDDLWNAEKARDELIRISFGYWDYIKNAWPEREQAACYALTYVPITDAKRESRRLVGDYILNQNDVQNAVPFPDRISYGGWPLDVHHPEGIFSGEEGPFDFNPRVPIYTIPFRCLSSKNIDNLLFAGRNMSVTHVALGTVRVQGTLAPLGQAAGTAAALCLQHNVTPRQLGTQHIRRLQQILLKHDQYIPGITNEDPDDLARKATITASSTADYEPFGHQEVNPAKELHPLNTPRAVMVPRGLKEHWRSVSLLLASERDEPQEVTLHIRSASSQGDYSAEDDLAVINAVVPPKRESFVEFPIDCAIREPFVWVWLQPTEGISWRLMNRAPIGSCRAYGGSSGRQWTVVEGQYYAVAVDPPLAIPADYRPENAVNGATRIQGDITNLWASDPEQPMPQWLALEFPEPTKFNTVYLTFDTDMNNRYHDEPFVPQCVREYELSHHDGTQWTTILRENGNFQRRRVHRFDTVVGTKLKLTVHGTDATPAARLFEIRVYDEQK